MYQVKNWEKFQHFKNRRPPWIKLYRDILDDRCIMTLDNDKFKLLICLWLIASENEGNLPSVEDIAWRLKSNTDRVLSGMRYLCDIKMISKRYQDDTPEKRRDREETETETETEKETETNTQKETLVSVSEEKTKSETEKQIGVCVFDSFDSVSARMTDEFKTVLDIWQDERKKAGLRTITDNQTKNGAAKLGQELKAGNITEADLRQAFKTALTNEDFKKYSLSGISNNLAKVLDAGIKTKSQDQKGQCAGVKPKEVKIFETTCECGYSSTAMSAGERICPKCKKTIIFS